MALPLEAIGTGAIMGAAWLGREMIRWRANGNGKPGKSQTCIDNIKLLAGHEILIIQLKESAKTIHKENREDSRAIIKRLDNLIGSKK